MKTIKWIRRVILFVLCLCMILPILSVPIVSAEKTPGTVERIADTDTTDSYSNLVALRNESRRAGRVWADKSVFTDSIKLDMDTDGYNGTVSTDEDFLHVFSTLGSSQFLNTTEPTPLDVVLILDTSGSMYLNGTKDYHAFPTVRQTKFYYAIDALNKAMKMLMGEDEDFAASPYNRLGLVTFATEVGDFELPLDHYSLGKNKDIYFKIDANLDSSSSVDKTNMWVKSQDFTNSDGYCYNDENENNNYNGGKGLFHALEETYTQGGLSVGMQMLANRDEADTYVYLDAEGNAVDPNDKNAKPIKSKIKRQPVVIMLTDGEPNQILECTADTGYTNWWGNLHQKPTNFYRPLYNTSVTTSSVGFMTLVTASYWKQQINKTYFGELNPEEGSSKTEVYTLGLQLATNSNNYPCGDLASIVLDPTNLESGGIASTDTAKRINNFFSQYTEEGNESVTVTFEQRADGYGPVNYDVNHPASDDISSLNYVDKYKQVDVAEGLDDVFADLIKDISSKQAQAFVPIGGTNDVGLSDNLSYVDPIGKYMEVKSVKNVLLFGKLYSVDKYGSEVYCDEKGNPATEDDYTYIRQYYRITNDEEITNPCYGDDSSVKFNLSDVEIYVSKTGNFRDPDVEGGGSLSDTGADESLYINIPANALPMQVASITENSDGSITYETNVGEDEVEGSEEYIKKKTQSTPIRVFYEVGISDEIKTENNNVDMTKISPDYVSEHKDGDKVYFYSNWYNKGTYSDYVTGDTSYTYGDPFLTFSPSEDNRYYIFQKALPLFTNSDEDKTGGVVIGSEEDGWTFKDTGKSLGEPVANKVDSDKWYYILIEYYSKTAGAVRYALPRLGSEFGSGIGGTDGGAAKNAYLCWYSPDTGEWVDYTGEDSKPDDGDYIIAAKPGGLRVGDMAAGIGIKGNNDNKTKTAGTYYLPTVSSSTGSGYDSDDSGDGDDNNDFSINTLNDNENKVIINLYLGNNGRVTVSNTQLLVTKEVDSIGADRDVLNKTAFKYTISLEGQNDGVYPVVKAIREEGSGTWRALIEKIELIINNQGLLLKNDSSRATVSVDTDGNIDPEGTDYYVYIGSTGSDENSYTLFDYYDYIDEEGDTFEAVLGTDQELTVAVAYLVPVSDYNNEWSFPDDGSLKEILEFPVGRVGFDENTQIGFAVKTDYQSNTAYLTENLYFADGSAEFTLKDGEGLLFIGLDSGANYTVTEILTPDQVDDGIILKNVTHKENDSDNNLKTTVYYASDFNNENTYPVSGNTTAVLTEEVNYCNYLPKTEKTETEYGENGFVNVGDTLTYEIYWENYAMDVDNDHVAQDIEEFVTVTDKLDPGVDFVSADFDEPTNDEKYKEIESPSYDEDTRIVTWRFKAGARQYGYVRLNVTVNENAVKYWNGYEEITPSPDPDTKDYAILNKASAQVDNYSEIHTDIVKTNMSTSHKTEINADGTPVSEEDGNLREDEDSGNLVGPKVDKDSTITYSISFINNGDEETTVTVIDKLDPGVDFVSASYGSVTLEAPSEDTEPDDDKIDKVDGDVKIEYDYESHSVIWEIQNVAPLINGEVTLDIKVNEDAVKDWHYTNGINGDSVENSKDYKIFNRASVIVGEGEPQFTETIENPLPRPVRPPKTELPQTGGIETVIFLIFGGILILVGITLLFVCQTKKKQKRFAELT